MLEFRLLILIFLNLFKSWLLHYGLSLLETEKYFALL